MDNQGLISASMDIGDRPDILIVDDKPDNLRLLSAMLSERGYKVRCVVDGATALLGAQSKPPDLVLLDVKMPEMNGYEVCRRLKSNASINDIPVIFLSALDESEDKVEAFACGGVDYITKPFELEEVLARINNQLAIRDLQRQLQQEVAERRAAETEVRALNTELEQRVNQRTQELEREIAERKAAQDALQRAMAELEQNKNRLQVESDYLQEEILEDHNFGEIIGHDAGLHQAMKKVEQIAPLDVTVLVLGETGTGKELIARAIHNSSARKERALIKVNCAVLQPNLIESELFGHEKGSFIGAISRRIGRFELADGGTIFLDEIGELAPELQTKLLRVLQEGEFERIGSAETIKVDVRIIAATNRNLTLAIQRGEFREDLFYRLNSFPVTLPPLRQRQNDIPLLVETFARRFANKLGKQIKTIPPKTMRTLQEYSWPGNVRELKNVIERSVVLSPGASLQLDDIFETNPLPSPATAIPAQGQTLEEMERNYIIQTLKATKWKISGSGGAAQQLGINPSTLRSRIKKLKISSPKEQDHLF